MGAPVKKRWITWSTSAIIGIALLLGHPYLLGVRGRIDEYHFHRDLRLGMARSEILTLARRFGGRVYVPSGTFIANGAPELLRVSFVDSFTFCSEDGKEYQLSFSSHWRLTGWTVSDWGNAC
jgi:hypothetical protein